MEHADVFHMIPADWNEKDYCAIPKEDGSTHCFLIGQTIKIDDIERKIEDISRDEYNKLLLTISGEDLPADTASSVTIIPQSNTENFEIEDFKYLASYNPIKKLKGKLNIPIDTYTDYAINVGGSSLVNSLYIKAVNNACSSLINSFFIRCARSASTLTPLNLMSTRQGKSSVSKSKISSKSW